MLLPAQDENLPDLLRSSGLITLSSLPWQLERCACGFGKYTSTAVVSQYCSRANRTRTGGKRQNRTKPNVGGLCSNRLRGNQKTMAEVSSSLWDEDIAKALRSNADLKNLLKQPRPAPPPTPADQGISSRASLVPVVVPAAQPRAAYVAPPERSRFDQAESGAVQQLQDTVESLLRDLGRALMEKQSVEVCLAS